MNADLGVRAQLSLIATLRGQLFRNSLRTIRGRLEVVSRAFVGLTMAGAWLGIGIAVGAGSYFIVSQGKTAWLAGVLWAVFLFWQLFPLVASTFTVSFEFTNLLRFPVRFSSFFLLALIYGLFDPASIAGCFWLFCMAAGMAIARPALLVWAGAVLLLFATVNVLLGRMIFAWIEKWLARRRTREVMAVIFFLFVLGFQLIGPIVDRWGHAARPMAARLALLLPVERVLPPGLAGAALDYGARGGALAAASAFGLLLAYGLLFGWLLAVRLRAQYRGEDLGETLAPAAVPVTRTLLPGWNLPRLTEPVAAVFEKEFRYLFRSGPIVFTMVMPLFILVLFRFMPETARGHGNPLASAPDLAFPIGAAYALLMLTNLVYNSLGVDGAGIQFLLSAPVRFRDILWAKNLAHSTILGLEVALVWVGVCVMFRPPSLGIVAATLAGILFALPVNLLAGNLLSLYAPRKFDLGTFGRQRASGITVLISLAVQAVVLGLAAAALLLARHLERIWVATTLFLALAAVAGLGYRLVLDRCSRIALERREALVAELCKQ